MTDLEKLLIELKDAIKSHEQEAYESSRVAMNSYGAGYNRGYVEGMKYVISRINHG